jgi:hypothetical protein
MSLLLITFQTHSVILTIPSVNVATKSGTNDLHGSFSYFKRDEALSANYFGNNRRNLPKPERNYDRLGFTIGGPVVLPSFGEGGRPLWVGRNKTFFFFGFEKIDNVLPAPQLYSVPTDMQRRGDFSRTLGDPITVTKTKEGCIPGAIGQTVTWLNPIDGKTPVRRGAIYDPKTAVKLPRVCDYLTNTWVNDRIVRLPFANNIIPQDRISPLALQFLKYFPTANTAANSHDQENFASPDALRTNYVSYISRIDHNFSDKHRTYFTIFHNDRMQNQKKDWSGEVNGIVPTGAAVARYNYGASADYVYTPTSSLIINLRGGFLYHSEREKPYTYGKISPSDFAFSQRALDALSEGNYLPGIGIAGYSGIGSGKLGDEYANYTYSFSPNVTMIRGNHNFRFGYDLRVNRENDLENGSPAGGFTFGNDYTKGPFEVSTADDAQGVAAFLLGMPTSGSVSYGSGRSNQVLEHALFFHDDWRVNNRLTLNLGIRYEYEAPATERYNRNVYGFDTLLLNPGMETQVIPKYATELAAFNAKNRDQRFPLPAASQFGVKGGVLFNSEESRGFWKPDRNNILPKFGFAYKLDDRTVLRGGTGFSSQPHSILPTSVANLYTSSTSLTATTNSGLSIGPGACSRCGDFNDPFPVLLDPIGMRYGQLTRLNGTIPTVKKNSMFQNWSIGGQREIGRNFVVELSYIGNRSWDRSSRRNLNAMPRQYLSNMSERDVALINEMALRFKNPYMNSQYLSPDETLYKNQEINKDRLLLPYPLFGDIWMDDYQGSTIYHSGQAIVEKRLSNGYQFSANYTWSKNMEKLGRLNQTDTELERVISADDVTHRFAMMGIFELPFGRNRMWGKGWNSLVEGVLGGWQLGATYYYQGGRPRGFGDIYFEGSLDELRNLTVSNSRLAIREDMNPSQNWYGNNAFGVDMRTLPFFKKDPTMQSIDPVTKQPVLDFNKQVRDPRIKLDRHYRTMPSRFSWLRGGPRFNMDLSLMKKIRFGERTSLQLRAEALNATNSVLLGDPVLDPTSLNFGTISDQQTNLPRDFQLGMKFVF